MRKMATKSSFDINESECQSKCEGIDHLSLCSMSDNLATDDVQDCNLNDQGSSCLPKADTGKPQVFSSRKKIKKNTVHFNLSPKLGANEPTMQKGKVLYSNEKDVRSQKKGEKKRSIFQGNKHGVLEGGVALIPAGSLKHERIKQTFKQENNCMVPILNDLEKIPNFDGDQVSPEHHCRMDTSEEDSNFSCSTSYGNANEKNGRNGLDMMTRENISNKIIGLATYDSNAEIEEVNEILDEVLSKSKTSSQRNLCKKNSSQPEFSQVNVCQKQPNSPSLSRPKNETHKIVRSEKPKEQSKIDCSQQQGIKKGYTRKGKKCATMVQLDSLDLCMNVSKVEMKQQEIIPKTKMMLESHSTFEHALKPEDSNLGFVMTNNVVMNDTFDVEDMEDVLSNPDELRLFSSRNGDCASIRDNIVFQSIDRAADIEHNEFERRHPDALLISSITKEIGHYNKNVNETIAPQIISPMDSMDGYELFNQSSNPSKGKQNLLSSWTRKSYELGERASENVSNPCLQNMWQWPSPLTCRKNSRNNRKTIEIVSRSVEDFSLKFKDCAPMDIEKIEIEDLPLNNDSFFLNVPTMESAHGSDIYSSQDEFTQHPDQNDIFQNTQDNQLHQTTTKNDRPWSASCLLENSYNKSRDNEDVHEIPRQPFSKKEPYRRSIESNVPGSRLNGLHTSRKKILKDVSARHLAHQNVTTIDDEKENKDVTTIDDEKENKEVLYEEIDSTELMNPHGLELMNPYGSLLSDTLTRENTLQKAFPTISTTTQNQMLNIDANVEFNDKELEKVNQHIMSPSSLDFHVKTSCEDENKIKLCDNKDKNLCETKYENLYDNEYKKLREDEDKKISTIHCQSCEDHKISETFACDDNKASSRAIENKDHNISPQINPNVQKVLPTNYDGLIKDLTRKYTDCKEEIQLSFEALEKVHSSINHNLNSNDSSVISPSCTADKTKKVVLEPHVDTTNQVLCPAEISNCPSYLEHESKCESTENNSKCSNFSNSNDRASLSAEKLSSILSYLGQVEESNRQEGNALLMPKICENLYGEYSPRTVLDHEDALSFVASSSTSRSTLQTSRRNEGGCIDITQVMNCRSPLPTTITVLDGVKKKMQELKEKIAFQEASILRLESEKQSIHAEKEDAIQKEKERFGKEVESRAAEYRAAIQHHLSLNEKMIKDKEKLSEKCCSLAVIVNTTESRFEEKLKALNEQWARDLHRQKELWSIGEKSKREAWMEKKTKELKELTIKGLEPHLENVVEKHRQEMRSLESRLREENKQQLEEQSDHHFRSITELRERLLKERDDFIDKERLSTHARMNEVAERYERQAIEQRMHIASELTSKLEKVEALRREEKLSADEHINSLQKEISERDLMFADHVGKAVDMALLEKEKGMHDEKEKLHVELKSWQQSFDEIVAKEIKKREKDIQARCVKERDEQIELVLEKMEQEKDIEIAQTQKDKTSRLEELLEEKRDLVKELRNQESQFTALKRELIEGKIRAEKELAEANIQIASLHREGSWQAHLIEQLKMQGEHEREEFKSNQDELVASIKEYKQQIQQCNAQVQEMKDRKAEELAELEARVKLAILKKDSFIEGLKHQVIMAQKQIQQTEILLQEEQRAIVADL